MKSPNHQGNKKIFILLLLISRIVGRNSEEILLLSEHMVQLYSLYHNETLEIEMLV